jgi:nicotinate-nucleotide adenylyltransferase
MKSRLVLPPNAPGMRIGLFGGSFNPPHEAHRAVTLFAMKRLQLDRVWWLVTPGNPLKDNKGLPPLETRIADAEALAAHPRIDVTGIEAVIGTKYSYDTIVRLLHECPQSRFVWIMGVDNLKSFHRWKQWQGIAAAVPIAVVDRGGTPLSMLGSPAAQALARARIPESRAMTLADETPPAWVFLHGMKLALSSTELRAAKNPGLRS